MPLGPLGFLQGYVEVVDLRIGRFIQHLALQVRRNAAVGEQVHHRCRHQLKGRVACDELCHQSGTVVVGFNKLGITLLAKQLEGGVQIEGIGRAGALQGKATLIERGGTNGVGRLSLDRHHQVGLAAEQHAGTERHQQLLVTIQRDGVSPLNPG